jgi:short-subunit dehydrogenase
MFYWTRTAKRAPLKMKGTQNEQRKKVVLVTGSSVGLGLAIAKKLIDDDEVFLVLTARKQSLNRFCNESIFESRNLWIRNLDVVNHKQIKTLVEEINEKLGGVDVLVNNAGIAACSTVEESTSHYRQRQLDVNYLGSFELISQVLSTMRKRQFGKIINISSVGGFMAMPTMSAYSASKFALEGATESLWYEVRPFGINVTLIIPGFINSDGFARTVDSRRCRQSLKNFKSTYHNHYIGMKRLIYNRMHRSLATNEKIACKVHGVIKRKCPPLRVYVTVDAWLFFLIRRFCPPKIYFSLSYIFLPNVRSWGQQNKAS